MRLPRLNEAVFRFLFVGLTLAIGSRLNWDRLGEAVVVAAIFVSAAAAYVIAVNLPAFIESKMEEFGGQGS